MSGQAVAGDARSGRQLGCPDRPGMTKPSLPVVPSLPAATGNPQSDHAGPGFRLSTKTVIFVRNGELEVPVEYN